MKQITPGFAKIQELFVYSQMATECLSPVRQVVTKNLLPVRQMATKSLPPILTFGKMACHRSGILEW